MSSQPEPDRFRSACALWATGIAVVTLIDASGVPHGMTVNSFTSVSLEPPLVLVCIDYRATILPHLPISQSFAINILAEEHAELSSRFARKLEDRFENLDSVPGRQGAPMLSGALAVFECSVVQSIPAGDHQIVVAQVHSVNSGEGRPLLYFASGYQTLA
jgi:flavin reductase (DIM6/NTAB) family NADH-FMN oxidoreductase RutF